MFGLNKLKPVDEYAATGETERVYHEIRQVLRVPGVNLVFRTLASFDDFFPMMWDAMRPNAETRVFEHAGDTLRKHAVMAAQTFPLVQVFDNIDLGPSQKYQIRAALRLYHYINPKLLLFVSAVRLALRGELAGGSGHDAGERIERGVPQALYPMEMIEEEQADEEVSAVFEDIKETLKLPSINSDYRTLALWPSFLSAAWHQVKPIVERQDFQYAATTLQSESRNLARMLTLPVPLSRERIQEMSGDLARIESTLDSFEELLPGLILNIAIMELDAEREFSRLNNPCPAATRLRCGVS